MSSDTEQCPECGGPTELKVDGNFQDEVCQECGLVVGGGRIIKRAIPHYVVTSAAEGAKEHDQYVVIRSDNDYQYARTLPEANTIADEMRAEIKAIAPISHTVQVIDLETDSQ